MPKRTDINSILILGAGPIVIGQACEFDYSGAQACKALREEGYRVILVNSNPATIMTDPEMADATYIEPITWQAVRQIIALERPDAILPTMGGQTALNCALALNEHGVLAEFSVQLLGASVDAIQVAEDRDLFKRAMSEIGLESAYSGVARNMTEALELQQEIGFPTVIRPSFTLGGSGGGIAYNAEEFQQIVSLGLDLSPTSEVLLEESLLGWKEFEMEVVRDSRDNAIIVCSIENFDPMGVHTGDSITVAPAQTLTDKEYQVMRNASIAILRKIGVETGGSNVQFAVNPDNGRLVVIEMNPRVSRSSALASKATGFPIAKIAAKLAVGYTLDELKNEITDGKTPASFEPSIDYVVTKIPRFNFEKFPGASSRLSTQMKSVGEVMAMGRNFQESLQKALRGLEIGVCGFDEPEVSDLEQVREKLANPSPERIFYLAQALRLGMSLDEIHQLSAIDCWFLAQIAQLVAMEQTLQAQGIDSISDYHSLRAYKRAGFADQRLAVLCEVAESDVRNLRHNLGLHPVYKRVDSCAAEFASHTAYLYSTYEEECEALPSNKQKILILGGGPNRIGQGIEFDYCCVHASLALRQSGFETIMVNCNPETVSTDYDTSDRLYFEPLTLEDVLEIVKKENPMGCIIHYGGQTPLKLANLLEQEGVPIIGTSPDAIDLAEDRSRFQQMLAELGLRQPENCIANTLDEALAGAERIGYPLVARPSYVLGGRAMQIIYDAPTLITYMNNALKHYSDALPILLDRFLNDAIEVDVDAISDGVQVLIAGIMEHVEEAGVHSGDSACVLPPYSLSPDIQAQLSAQVIAMAQKMGVVGLLNTQFAIKDDTIYVLEVNPRASRTVPFVSKAIGLPLAKIAARVMAGKSLAEQGVSGFPTPNYFAVKEAVFPFSKFAGVDVLLGPEMKSTGEVMGIGETFPKAFARALVGAGENLPEQGSTVFLSVKDSDKDRGIVIGQILADKGYQLLATRGTYQALIDAGIAVTRINKIAEGRPNIVDAIKNRQVALVINTTENAKTVSDSYHIRREAMMSKILYCTTISGANAVAQALLSDDLSDMRCLQTLHKSLA